MEASDHDAGRTHKLWESMHAALHLAETEGGIKFADFDKDGDGEIDAITFLHSGYDACYGATDCTGRKQTERIWSHKRGMDTWVSQDGIRVSQYNISPALHAVCGDDINHIGVISHELGHYLGIADLYDRASGGCGIGIWGLMGSGIGYDHSGFYPPIMSAYGKAKLGWATLTEITHSGRYSLEASVTSNQVYKIQQGYPEGEYLLIENRQPKSFDKKIPGGGIAIWHIDEKAKFNSIMDINAARGFPGMGNWPASGDHYSVALLQADGKYNLEKNNNCGDGTDLFYEGGVNELLPSADEKGPYPNTDAYQNGIVIRTNHAITNISKSGNIMTFDVIIGTPETLALAQAVSPSSLKPCETWCDKVTDTNWETRCSWEQTCAGCSQCNSNGGISSLAASAEVPCKTFCAAARDVSWEKKCILDKCAGCEECLYA